MFTQMAARRLMRSLTTVLLLCAPAVWAAPWPAEVPARGPADAPVTVLVASEFQCTYCARVAPNLAALQAAHPKQIRLGFLNFPLPFHKNALPAAQFAWAAHQQGKFWPIHDALFAQQTQLGDELWTNLMAKHGLDAVRMGRDQESEATMAGLDRQQRALTALGVTGTPTLFFNGKQVTGAQPLQELESAFAAALADAPKPAETLTAAWERHAPGMGGKVADFLMLGKEPPPPPPPAPPAEDPEDFPERLATVWKVPVDPRTDQIRGDGPQALVTLVTFTDLQCPFCARLRTSLEAVRAKYPGQVREVFKHLPLPFHPQARPAHLAALAAARQGKFWEFQDAAFSAQPDLSEPRLAAIAKTLDLDVARWTRDRADPALAAQIERDLAAGDLVGVDGTPTLYVNGRRILGALPPDRIAAVVDQELTKAKASGLTGQAAYDRAIASGRVIGPLGDDVVPARPAGVPAQGPAAAKVEVVVFFDYQCPYCVRLASLIAGWWPAWAATGQVQVVWAPCPLSFHAQAKPAAVAAQLAWAKGKFDALHPRLVALGSDGKLSPESIAQALRASGVDAAEYQAALADGRYDAVIDASWKKAKESGVQGTPTVFVGGRLFSQSSAQGYAPLQGLVCAQAACKSAPPQP